ncbi:hypothetical protein [uncultured Tateyamaria sp.]|uniref:hypothetical protein n=1 Tax=uncultured Tateyamaria sp. TaxID=455651 RepID=UPI0026144D00|nr:hypothetical protein [uncultured Tateyamaria sp.]
MPTEIRKISFTEFRKHASRELKFVHEEMGHLWLHHHRKPMCVVIPMRDEMVLHRAIGLNPEEALHRACVDHARRVAAIEDTARWRSEPVLPLSGGYPPMGMDDAEYAAWKAARR